MLTSMTPGSGVTASLFRRGSRGGVSPSMMTGVPISVTAVSMPGDEIEIILRRLDRRHEDMQPPVARLDAQRGADDPRRALAGRGRRNGFSSGGNGGNSTRRVFQVTRQLRALAADLAGQCWRIRAGRCFPKRWR
jgi:hypothetical protein